jgi:hypothetical protein
MGRSCHHGITVPTCQKFGGHRQQKSSIVPSFLPAAGLSMEHGALGASSGVNVDETLSQSSESGEEALHHRHEILLRAPAKFLMSASSLLTVVSGSAGINAKSYVFRNLPSPIGRWHIGIFFSHVGFLGQSTCR